jgi:hypothetical protein
VSPDEAMDQSDKQEEKRYAERKCYYEIVGLKTRNSEVGESNCWLVISLRRMSLYVYAGYLGVQQEPGCGEGLPIGYD